MSRVRGADRQRWFRRGVIIFIIVCAIVAMASLAAYFAERNQDKPSGEPSKNSYAVPDNNVKETLSFGGKDYKLKNDIEAVLIMGVDENEIQQNSNNYVNGNQADFLLLLVFDHKAKTYTSLAINRDTITEVPVLGLDGEFAYWSNKQIALSHAYGNGMEKSCENTVLAVSKMLQSVPIEHYASLSMPVIGVANDAVGGVTVEISDDFGSEDTTLIKGTTVTLNAQQAEHFVRGRAGVADQTNINRMSRQKTFIAAWKKQALDKLNSDSNFVLTLIGLVSDYMVSDMTIDELSDVANYMAEYTDQGTLDIKGESRVGEFMEFYPDENALMQTVVELFYEPQG